MVNVCFNECIMKILELVEITTKIFNNLFNLIIASVKLYLLLYLLFTANEIKNSIVKKVNTTVEKVQSFSIFNMFK